jgi:lipopolysaccharide export system permease protein
VKLLQRYILGELVRVFLLLAIVLTFMLVFLGVFREASERGLRVAQILQIMPFVVPSMLPFTIPATLLLAVCVVYGRISGDLEVAAAKSAGISAFQLLAPAFLLAGLLAGGSFGLSNYAIPWAMANIERIVTQAIEDIFLDGLARHHYYADEVRGYTITVHDVRDRTLIDATFQYRTQNHQQFSLRAEAASVRFDLENKVIRLKLVRASGTQAETDSEAEINHTELTFPLPESIARVKARHMTLHDLLSGITTAKQEQTRLDAMTNQEAAMLLAMGEFSELADGSVQKLAAGRTRARNDELRFNTEVHSRFSMSAGCLFFVFVGGPFSMLQARRQFLTTFVMCFLPILLIYYPVLFLMLNLSRSATVDPAWAMWTPNLILFAVGLSLLGRVIRH